MNYKHPNLFVMIPYEERNRVSGYFDLSVVGEEYAKLLGDLTNAIKLIENALKEARQGAFRVRNCRGFEKMCIPNRRRGTPPEKL